MRVVVALMLVASIARAQTDVVVPPSDGALTPPSGAASVEPEEKSPPASMLFFYGCAMWAMAAFAEQNDADEYGGTAVLIPALYWAGAGTAAMAQLFQIMSTFDPDPDYSDPKGEYGAVAYRLDYKKSSALTGSLQRKPKGLGLGWDFDGFYSDPKWGYIGGAALTYQQSDLESTDWVDIAATFTKLDFFVGVDVARLASGFTGIEFLKRQRLRFRIGPSYFKNSIVVADEGSPFNTVRKVTLYESAPLVSGWGYNLLGEVALDFDFLGGLEGSIQRGVYPSLSFPELSGEQAAYVALVGFDDLRRGKGYTYQKIEAHWALPFIGYWGSEVLVGAQFTRYENDQGTGVNNRGFDLGMRGQF